MPPIDIVKGKAPKKRNMTAASLSQPQFQPRTMQNKHDKRAYKRKAKHKEDLEIS